jgi:hypothetical protein
MGVEIFSLTNDFKYPDPKKDELTAVFYSIYPKGSHDRIRGVIVNAKDGNLNHEGPKETPFRLKRHILKVTETMLAIDELTLLRLFAMVVVCYDVDIIWGHETDKYSIAFIRQRWAYKRFGTQSQPLRCHVPSADERTNPDNKIRAGFFRLHTRVLQ